MEKHELKWFLSGGASNTDPNLSLGGVKSTTELISQSFNQPINITGCIINYAASNAYGDGTLFYTDGLGMAWLSNGRAITTEVDVSVSGDYTIVDNGGGYLVVTTVGPSLPTGPTVQDTITISPTAANLFDDITAGEAQTGDVEYRCIYLHNTNITETLFNGAVWTFDLPDGDSQLSYGIDPAGLNGTATTIVDEDTAPAGVTFLPADSEGLAVILGDIPPNNFLPIWIRRNIAIGSTNATVSDISAIRVKGGAGL